MSFSQTPSHSSDIMLKTKLDGSKRDNSTESGEGDLKVEMREADQPTTTTTINIPDGGLMAWQTVFGGWCLMFATFGMTTSFGVYQDFYSRFWLTNYTPSQIGWVGSVQLFLLFFLSLPAGLLFDRGYFYYMNSVFSALYILAFFLLSLCKPQQLYQVFLCQGFGMGLSIGFLFLPAVAIVSHHFQRRRALCMGIVMSGSACGGMLYPWMINHFIEEKGFAYATRAAASVSTGLLVVANLLMRTRLPPKHKRPEGSLPPPDVKSFFKDVPYVTALFGAFMLGLGQFFPIFYIQLFAVLHKVDKTLAFHTLTILNGASLVGRIIPPFFGDLWGPWNVVGPFSIIQTAMIFVMLGINSTSAIIAFAIVFGFASGACLGLSSGCLAATANSIHEVGARIGLTYLTMSFGMLSFSPIAGALLGEHYDWNKAIAFHGVCLILNAIAFISIRFMLAARRGTHKV